MNDLRFAFRQLLKNPGFTAVAVLGFAFGIGTNTAIFSVVNAVLLRSLPYPKSDRLVRLSEAGNDWSDGPISYPNFTDWKAQQTVFEHIGLYRWVNYNLTGTGEPLRLSVGEMAADAFAALRVQPALGRTFTADEDKPGGPTDPQTFAAVIGAVELRCLSRLLAARAPRNSGRSNGGASI